ncbi:SapC family protein [Pseudorhodobacter turbinis]|uniref:SapC family protein n=1 Tax=Pseudorhodobacter turbinis TaxID=2500533 RepID=A0A4P8EDI1_9RHOB|nr:SapC family protein [Pseudorhodobacter turbinis]QCO54425.1 SapC family protein [Pseudorhodobacter turbinis]
MHSSKPLFYKTVVPLDTRRHGSLRISSPLRPLEYAREANVIPALVDEFDLAMAEIPIAFLPGTDGPSAVFVTGSAPGTNMYVTDGGLWSGTYVPAYLRRYPFIIGEVSESEAVLCLDESYEGLGEVEGDRFFSDTGEQQEALTNALTLAQSYRDAAVRTEKFCAMLRDFDLLQTATLDTTAPDGSKSVVHGLLIVNEAAIAALSADKLYALHAEGFLKAVYSQIASLRAVSKLLPDVAPKARPKSKKTA